MKNYSGLIKWFNNAAQIALALVFLSCSVHKKTDFVFEVSGLQKLHAPLHISTCKKIPQHINIERDNTLKISQLIPLSQSQKKLSNKSKIHNKIVEHQRILQYPAINQNITNSNIDDPEKLAKSSFWLAIASVLITIATVIIGSVVSAIPIIISVLLSILFIGCILASLVFGFSALKKYKNSADKKGKGFAIAGLIISGAQAILALIALIFGLIVFLFILWFVSVLNGT